MRLTTVRYKVILILTIILLFAIPALATDYFVNQGCATPDGDGTTGQCDGGADDAFDSVQDVEAKGLATGDDVYIKEDTTENLTSSFLLNWIGSSGNQSIIGAYHDDGADAGEKSSDVGYSLAGARPILNGGANYVALDMPAGTDYVTVEYLDLRSAATSPLRLGQGENIGIIIQRNNIVANSPDTGHGIYLRSNSTNSTVKVLHNTVSMGVAPTDDLMDGIKITESWGLVHVGYNDVHDFDHSQINITATTGHTINEVWAWKNEAECDARGYGHGIDVSAYEGGQIGNIFMWLNYEHDLKTGSKIGPAANIYSWSNIVENLGVPCCGTGNGYDDTAKNGYFNCVESYGDQGGTCDPQDPTAHQICPEQSITIETCDNTNIINHGYYNISGAATEGDKNQCESSGTTMKGNLIFNPAIHRQLTDEPAGYETTGSNGSISFYRWAGSNPCYTSFTISNNLTFWKKASDWTTDLPNYTNVYWEPYNGIGASYAVPTDGGATGINQGGLEQLTATANKKADPLLRDPFNTDFSIQPGGAAIDFWAGISGPSTSGLNPPSGETIAYNQAILFHETDFTDYTNTVTTDDQGDYGSSWEAGPIIFVPLDVAPTSIALANCSGTQDCDETGEVTFTRNAGTQTRYSHYASSGKIILPQSDCVTGTALGANSWTCETTTPASLTYDLTGYSGYSVKVCIKTYIDLDAASDCDTFEASVDDTWTYETFTIGTATPPAAYGATMSTSITNCPDASHPCGAILDTTPADCGGVACGATMAE